MQYSSGFTFLKWIYFTSAINHNSALGDLYLFNKISFTVAGQLRVLHMVFVNTKTKTVHKVFTYSLFVYIFTGTKTIEIVVQYYFGVQNCNY